MTEWFKTAWPEYQAADDAGKKAIIERWYEMAAYKGKDGRLIGDACRATGFLKWAGYKSPWADIPVTMIFDDGKFEARINRSNTPALGYWQNDFDLRKEATQEDMNGL